MVLSTTQRQSFFGLTIIWPLWSFQCYLYYLHEPYFTTHLSCLPFPLHASHFPTLVSLFPLLPYPGSLPNRICIFLNPTDISKVSSKDKSLSRLNNVSLLWMNAHQILPVACNTTLSYKVLNKVLWDECWMFYYLI